MSLLAGQRSSSSINVNHLPIQSLRHLANANKNTGASAVLEPRCPTGGVAVHSMTAMQRDWPSCGGWPTSNGCSLEEATSPQAGNLQRQYAQDFYTSGFGDEELNSPWDFTDPWGGTFENGHGEGIQADVEWLPTPTPRDIPPDLSIFEALRPLTKHFAIYYIDENGKERCTSSTSLAADLPNIYRPEILETAESASPFCSEIVSKRDKTLGKRKRGLDAEIARASNGNEATAERTSSKKRSGRRGSALVFKATSPRTLNRSHAVNISDQARPSNGGLVSKLDFRFRLRPRPNPSEIEEVKKPELIEAKKETSHNLHSDTESQEMVHIAVGDTKSCIAFYMSRFQQMQQIPCKAIAKDWIKAVEPKKQAKYPYNGGKSGKNPVNGQEDLYRPPWWPSEGCPHREPDHIKKDERLLLLLHILRNLWQPNMKSGPQAMSAAKLRLSTLKTVESFANLERGNGVKQWLSDIYKLRAAEERYLKGEIPSTTILSFQGSLSTSRRQPGLAISPVSRLSRLRSARSFQEYASTRTEGKMASVDGTSLSSSRRSSQSSFSSNDCHPESALGSNGAASSNTSPDHFSHDSHTSPGSSGCQENDFAEALVSPTPDPYFQEATTFASDSLFIQTPATSSVVPAPLVSQPPVPQASDSGPQSASSSFSYYDRNGTVSTSLSLCDPRQPRFSNSETTDQWIQPAHGGYLTQVNAMSQPDEQPKLYRAFPDNAQSAPIMHNIKPLPSPQAVHPETLQSRSSMWSQPQSQPKPQPQPQSQPERRPQPQQRPRQTDEDKRREAWRLRQEEVRKEFFEQMEARTKNPNGPFDSRSGATVAPIELSAPCHSQMLPIEQPFLQSTSPLVLPTQIDYFGFDASWVPVSRQ